jgi:hypothetical protein
MTLNECEDVFEYKCLCSKSIIVAKDVNALSVAQLREMLADVFER